MSSPGLRTKIDFKKIKTVARAGQRPVLPPLFGVGGRSPPLFNVQKAVFILGISGGKFSPKILSALKYTMSVLSAKNRVKSTIMRQRLGLCPRPHYLKHLQCFSCTFLPLCLILYNRLYILTCGPGETTCLIF
jgi:hypothetical protein